MANVLASISSLTGGLTLPETPLVTRLNLALLFLIASEANSFYLGSAIFKLLASLSFFFGGLGRALPRKSSREVNTIWPLLREFVEGRVKDRFAFWIVLGLGFSVLGDVMLIPSRESYYRTKSQTEDKKVEEKAKKSKKQGPAAPEKVEKKQEGDMLWFKAGTFSFALAHLAYTVAFILSPRATKFRWVGAILASVFGLGGSRVLGIFGGPSSANSWLTIPNDMVPLVKAYVGVITTMVAVASGADEGSQKTLGAWMFLISDLFVAVDVFGKKPAPSDQKTRSKGREGWRFRAIGWIFYFWAQMILAGCI